MTDKTYPSPCRNYLQPLYLSVTLYACAQRDFDDGNIVEHKRTGDTFDSNFDLIK